MSIKIKGIPASDGIVIARVLKLEHVKLEIDDSSYTDQETELAKFNNAIEKTVIDLTALRNKTARDIDEEHAVTFDAHIQIVNDPEFKNQVEDLIKNSKTNAPRAFKNISKKNVAMFESMDSEYMQERAADIKDVMRRVLSHLLEVPLSDIGGIQEEVIVVSDDLTPSDTAQFDRRFIKGFITAIGGRTSHSSIMARTLEIPAVVGATAIMGIVETGEQVILDGCTGEVVYQPLNEEIEKFKLKAESYQQRKQIWATLKDRATVTHDNHRVEIAANIGSPADLQGALDNGAEGIGLYRTELLYMDSIDFPTEAEQFAAYKEVLEKVPNKKVIIRTLDIGGDKHLDYLKLEKEINPSLGFRALRLCLKKTDIFKTQLRALLRASVYENLHIMFPMVATLNELRNAKKVLQACHEELLREGEKVGEYKVGIMVEIPSVAVLADRFAQEVDFFSIGTNDLIQFTFAADRINEQLSYLYQPFNPSILRLIKTVIDASHQENIWTSMCGEMASEPMAIPLLLGMGIDSFSMSASSVLSSRYFIKQLEVGEMKQLAERALQLGTSEEVYQLVTRKVNL